MKPQTKAVLMMMASLVIVMSILFVTMIPISAVHIHIIGAQEFQTTYQDQGTPTNYYLLQVLDSAGSPQVMMFSGTCHFSSSSFVLYKGIVGNILTPLSYTIEGCDYLS